MALQPNSIREWQDRENEAERREQALDRRYRRQQYEMFDEVMEDYIDESDPCPNCGEIGHEAVYYVDEDLSVGYSCEEQGCVACIDSFGRAK